MTNNQQPTESSEPSNSDDTLTVLLPVYNEEENLRPVIEEILEHLNDLCEYEILCVDDGSTDGSGELLKRLADEEDKLKTIHFQSNAGQSAAFLAGFRYIRTRWVVTMDSDGQNDPADIPKLWQQKHEADVIAGYRRNRRDSFSKKIASRIGNGIRNWITGDDIIDTGCSLKLFRREVVQSFPTFEGMHRFFPTLAKMEGYTVEQVPVNHRPRKRGTTKYTNWGRLKTTFADLWAVRWMQKRTIDYEIEESEGTREQRNKDARQKGK